MASHILLVDANAEERALCAFVLAHAPHGLTVDEAGDAVALADKIARGDFAAVVTECRLGWSDGLQVLKAVKRHDRECPVVWFTAENDPQAMSEALRLGLDGFVPKTGGGHLRLPTVVAELLERRGAGSRVQPQGKGRAGTFRASERRGSWNAAERLDRDEIDSLPVGFFAVSADAGFNKANRELARILGRQDSADLWGEDLADYLVDSAARIRWKTALTDETGVRGLTARLRRADGETAWVRITAWPDNKITAAPGVLGGVVEDVSALRRTETELAEATAALDRSNEELEQFAHVVSHDLQAPVQLMAGYARLLGTELEEQLPASGKDYVGHLIDNTRRIQTMIDDILEYLRLGSTEKPFWPVNLNEVIAEVLANLRTLAEAAGARITHDPLPTVNADRAQMMQLFQNLIGNAIKFHGEQAPRVHVAAREEEGAWAISVEDQGIGIDPKHHGRVFKIFQRAVAASDYSGTGVGLAICKRIVERHGGSIELDSAPSQGSTFLVKLAKEDSAGAGIPTSTTEQRA